jgi:N-acetylmuramoyl-L-alanine amidase
MNIIPLILSLLLLCGCSHAPYRPMPVEQVPTALPSFMPIEITPWQPLDRKNCTIVLDAGHGGDDFGAHSDTLPRYHEKNLNLALTQMVKSFLEQKGYNTLMTRMTDDFIPLDRRSSFSNQQNGTIFVSLHFNSAPSKQADGIEIYYYRSPQNKGRTESSTRLAEIVLKKVIQATQAKSRGVKHGDFAVIRQTTMPAILIEGGFLTNDAEMEKIKDPAYLKKLAWGITEGIQSFFYTQ